MPDVRKCAIYGCRSNSRDHKDLKFFNFPTRDSPLYDTWLSICHESAHILEKIKRPYICSNHFHSYHVGYRRLAMGAVPRLLLKAPPGFAEEELARAEEEAAAQREKDKLLNLINQSVYEWAKRAQYHPEFGKTLCTARRELQRVGAEIRNLLGATLTFAIDDYWLRKFRKAYLRDWNDFSGLELHRKMVESLDLIEIIKFIDPNVKISSEEEIAILVDEELKLSEQKVKIKKTYQRKPFDHCPPIDYTEGKNGFQVGQKRSFKEALEEFYGIESKKVSHSEIKVEKDESIDMSQHQDDDDGCFDVYSEENSGAVVMSEPIVETYQQALEHLKPLEDFALREENYRVIGLLSTLEIIFKNHRQADT